MLTLLLSARALACGGLFCNAVQPVDQVGERILFAHDEAAGEVEMVVQIRYEGPAEEFSWLLPVPAEPEVYASVDDVLSRLAQVTNPTFVATPTTVGTCPTGELPRLVVLQSSDVSFNDPPAQVEVAREAQVGPYDSQILTATDTASLVTWLTDNGYDLPEGAEEKLRPYVGAGGWFVGLKLRKDRDVGDLAPIGLRFASGSPMIPLQLTAVAAGPDLPLQPFVLGSSRYVPENYLHVRVNPFVVDWFTGGANYPEVVSRAADEAGGQAFATDFAGPVASLVVSLHFDEPVDLDALARVTDALDLEPLMVTAGTTSGDTQWTFWSGIPVTAGTMPILRRHVPKPAAFAGLLDQAFYECLSCYLERGQVPVDGAALTLDLAQEYWAPMQRAQRLLDAHPYLTRLTSSISADEMSVDPRFVANPSLGDARATPAATLRTLCRGVHARAGAPRELVLDDGRVLPLPSADAWFEEGWTWEAWIGEVGLFAAEVVEQTGRSGDPVVVTDQRPQIDEALADIRRGCGCDTSGGSSGVVGAALWAVARRRRRLSGG